MNSNALLWLIGILVVVVVLRRVIVVFLARTIFKGALKSHALASVPDEIHLQREAALPWRDPARAADFTRQFQAAGFETVGDFEIPEMSGTLLRLMLRPGDHVYANIHEHPRVGVWAEVAMRYTDGRAAMVTTLKPTGLGPPPWLKRAHLPGATAAQLLARLQADRQFGALDPLDAGNIVPAWEGAYARSTAWRKQKGMSDQELADTIKRPPGSLAKDE